MHYQRIEGFVVKVPPQHQPQGFVIPSEYLQAVLSLLALANIDYVPLDIVLKVRKGGLEFGSHLRGSC